MADDLPVTSTEDPPTPAVEPYGAHLGSVSYVCNRCGALVYPSEEAQTLHTEFHAALTLMATAVSQELL